MYDPASGARKSTNGEATTLFTTLILENVRTIAFARARKQAELLADLFAAGTGSHQPAQTRAENHLVPGRVHA